MIGKWLGKYSYSEDIPISLHDSITKFVIVIDKSKGSKFSGVVEDDLKTGGTKGIGVVKGKLNGNKVEFVKKMPIRTYIFPDGSIKEEDKPHHPIYYKGIINKDETSIEGTWKIKRRFGILNRKFYFFPQTKGVWLMKKEN